MQPERKGSYDMEKLTTKMLSANSVQALQLYGEQAKTAPDKDKAQLRDAYMKRLRELVPLKCVDA